MDISKYKLFHGGNEIENSDDFVKLQNNSFIFSFSRTLLTTKVVIYIAYMSVIVMILLFLCY